MEQPRTNWWPHEVVRLLLRHRPPLCLTMVEEAFLVLLQDHHPRPSAKHKKFHRKFVLREACAAPVLTHEFQRWVNFKIDTTSLSRVMVVQKKDDYRIGVGFALRKSEEFLTMRMVLMMSPIEMQLGKYLDHRVCALLAHTFVVDRPEKGGIFVERVGWMPEVDENGVVHWQDNIEDPKTLFSY